MAKFFVYAMQGFWNINFSPLIEALSLISGQRNRAKMGVKL
jgi:hypothetical protein